MSDDTNTKANNAGEVVVETTEKEVPVTPDETATPATE
jgi:hypothetical protein